MHEGTGGMKQVRASRDEAKSADGYERTNGQRSVQGELCLARGKTGTGGRRAAI